MNDEVLRLVDSMHRNKGVNKDTIFGAIEEGLTAAARKRFKDIEGDVQVKIDRLSGQIIATSDGELIELEDFGRIAARTAYQVYNQRIREAECDVIFDDYESKMDTLVTGTVQRFERGSIVVNLDKTEGVLPRSEQVFNESYRAGDRIRAYVLNVKKKGQKVVIILSRTHPNLVRALFDLEIPEVSDRLVEIKSVVREPGFRTKVAVTSHDQRVDPQGACIGVRGTRIRNIVEELNGERIDIVPWSESPELYIKKALSPAEITDVQLDREEKNARIIVPDDQLSLAIGKRGQNVRLAARLTEWHLDILTESDAKQTKDAMRGEMTRLPEVIEGLDTGAVDTLLLSGFTTLEILVQKGEDALKDVKGIGEEFASKIVEYATARIAELEQTTEEDKTTDEKKTEKKKNPFTR